MLYRILMPMINEAFFCMMEGTGSPEDIDKGLRLGTNMKLGPLRLADSIGARALLLPSGPTVCCSAHDALRLFCDAIAHW